MTETSAPRFIARPFVCGAVGAWDRATSDRLRANAPTGVRPVHTSPGSWLWSSHALPSWRADAHGWLWWPLADGDPPRSWQQAADDRGAAGLVVAGESSILHTCGLGFQELYTRRLGTALYFANRIEPLLDIDDSLLRTDWEAWATVLALGAPTGDATPFREVRRMTAATAWHAGPDGLRIERFEPRWWGTEPDPGTGVDEVRRALLASMPRQRWWRPIALTLSGGSDSRLLGALAVAGRPARAPLAWTTSPDDGFDEDVAMSGPVAAGLGLRHRVLIPEADAWRAERTVVFDRVQHQTPMHTWLMPLARRLHGDRRPLLDGLAGDVLLKSSFVDQQVLDALTASARCDLLWTRLSAGRLAQREWYGPGVAARFEEAGREAFGRTVARLWEHPAGVTLSVLLTRTARAITPSPLCVFAPEVDVRLPFTHPDFIAAALSVPIGTKVGGGFYRDLLARVAGPHVAELPSTLDTGRSPTPALRRQTQPAALAATVAPIAADETVRALLGPQLLPALTDPGERARIGMYNGPRTVLQWASMLADWRGRYASRLAPD